MDVRALHRRLIVHEATAVLRHDLRNKLAAVRNAAFYIRKRVEKDAAPVMASDPRLPRFFELTGTELDGAESILADQLPRLGEPATEPSPIDDAIALAVAAGASAEHQRSGLRMCADPGEVAVALLCLVENAVEAGATQVMLRGAPDGDRVAIEVCDDGPGIADPHTPRAEHLGLGLRIVRRIAARARGELVLEPRASGGVRAALVVPAAPRGASR